jgi:hypothetical protein
VQATIVSLGNNHLPIALRCGQNFTAQWAGPQLFAGTGVQFQNESFAAADEHSVFIHADATRERRFQFDFPHRVTGGALDRNHFTIGGGDINHCAINHRSNPVKAITLAVAHID